MEEEINVHYQELLNGNVKDQLLPNQLQRLLMCFDVYLETDIPASSLVPIEIPKEKMMPRTSRYFRFSFKTLTIYFIPASLFDIT